VFVVEVVHRHARARPGDFSKIANFRLDRNH
jgi:hypothetical protein